MPGMLLGLLDRDDAIAEAVKQFGEDGRGPPDTGLSHAAGGTALKDRPDGPVVELPPADVAVVEEQAKDTVAAEAKRLLSFANGEHDHLLTCQRSFSRWAVVSHRRRRACRCRGIRGRPAGGRGGVGQLRPQHGRLPGDHRARR